MSSDTWKEKGVDLAIKAGLIIPALIYFSTMIVIFAFLTDFLDRSGMLELQLFVGSLSAPIGVTAVGVWCLLVYKLRKSEKAGIWAKRLFIIYAIAAVAPYLLSFLITPASS